MNRFATAAGDVPVLSHRLDVGDRLISFHSGRVCLAIVVDLGKVGPRVLLGNIVREQPVPAKGRMTGKYHLLGTYQGVHQPPPGGRQTRAERSVATALVAACHMWLSDADPGPTSSV